MPRKKIECYFDGCCEPINPGGVASFGAVIFIDGQRIWECSKIFYPEKGNEKATSNNVAEYCGLIAIFEYLLENKLNKENIKIYGDSQLVINQIFGDWKMHGGYYLPFAQKAMQLFGKFKKTKLFWIPREQNNIADELSKAVLIKAGVKFKIQPEGKEIKRKPERQTADYLNSYGNIDEYLEAYYMGTLWEIEDK